MRRLQFQNFFYERTFWDLIKCNPSQESIWAQSVLRFSTELFLLRTFLLHYFGMCRYNILVLSRALKILKSNLFQNWHQCRFSIYIYISCQHLIFLKFRFWLLYFPYMIQCAIIQITVTYLDLKCDKAITFHKVLL